MMKVITLGNDLLAQQSELITDINDEIINLSNEMFKTMYFANGIGLAAVQVGVLKRMFVMDVPKAGKMVMINPKIIDTSLDTNIYEEGCLSLPGIGNDVERPASIIVEFIDIKGNPKKLEASGLLSTCIQHESDHLDGIIFIDRIPPEDRLKKIHEYNKLQTL